MIPESQCKEAQSQCFHKRDGGSLVAKLCTTLATPWTVAYVAPLSLGFPRQEYWSGLPFPSPGDLPKPGIEPGSSALQILVHRHMTNKWTKKCQIKWILTLFWGWSTAMIEWFIKKINVSHHSYLSCLTQLHLYRHIINAISIDLLACIHF